MTLVYKPKDDLVQNLVHEYLTFCQNNSVNEDIAYNILYSHNYSIEESKKEIELLPETYNPDFYVSIVKKEILDKPYIFFILDQNFLKKNI